MSGYTLTWRGCAEGQGPGAKGRVLIDGLALRPDTLGLMGREELAATPLRIGRTQVALNELFEIEGMPGEILTLRNTPALDALGALMQRGTLVIDGDVGDDLGASMSGGLIHVIGSAGHRVGGPHPTSRRGMTGGEILIDGDAGDHAGYLMRRGLIAIGGATGRSPGYRMIAGTIVLGREPGDHPGLEMQRGSIVCLDESAKALDYRHLVEGNTIDATAMPAMLMVLRRLRALGWPMPTKAAASGSESQAAGPLPRGERAGVAAGRWRLHSGDVFELNKGEVLQWVS